MTQPRTRLYIDNPWEDVEGLIREHAADEVAQALDCLTPAEMQVAEKIGRRIASSVMARLDGSECEADKGDLRRLA